MTESVPSPSHNDANQSSPAGPLSEEQFSALCNLLRNGASLSAACVKLGVSLEALLDAIAEDHELLRRYLAVQHVLSRNVATVLYHAAMRGSIPAQTFFLRHLPPPEWSAAAAQATALDDCPLSDEELETRCRILGIEFAPQALGEAPALGGAGPEADAARPGPVSGPGAA